jgi:hypothetical protein
VAFAGLNALRMPLEFIFRYQQTLSKDHAIVAEELITSSDFVD